MEISGLSPIHKTYVIAEPGRIYMYISPLARACRPYVWKGEI